MISNHVTYFILFYSIGRTLCFFFFSSSSSFKLSLASQNAFLLVWIRHRSFSWTTLVYVVWFLFMGGLFVFWIAGRSLPPSPSLPWLSPESPFQRRASTLPVPVLHPLVWLVPVWMCSLVHHALLRSISLALTLFVVCRWKRAEGVAAI